MMSQYGVGSRSSASPTLAAVLDQNLIAKKADGSASRVRVNFNSDGDKATTSPIYLCCIFADPTRSSFSSISIVNPVLKYKTISQQVKRIKLSKAGVFPRAAQIDSTKERNRKYTKAISHSGARITSLYLTPLSGMGLPYRILRE